MLERVSACSSIFIFDSEKSYTRDMTWQEVRQYHPNTWLLLEALEAHSQDGFRILDKLAVISVFEDSTSALNEYQALHRKDRARELYVLHSSREQPGIQERFWMGIRGAA
jgi:hypothetical protein